MILIKNRDVRKVPKLKDILKLAISRNQKEAGEKR